jgi:hypothetical protein
LRQQVHLAKGHSFTILIPGPISGLSKLILRTMSHLKTISVDEASETFKMSPVLIAEKLYFLIRRLLENLA